jgi:polar amino acid transport system substrate-binding protein
MTNLRPRSSVPWQRRVVLAYIDEPPFAKPASDGRASGCDVELARTVLHAIGVLEVDFCLTTFAELIPGVAVGRWTINAPLFVTPQRAACVAFSRPVWALDDGFIVAAGNPKRIDSYRTIAAQGFRLGVVAGQVQRDSAVRAGVSTDHIWEFATQQAAIEALLAGRIDAYTSASLGNRIFVRELENPRLLAVEAHHVQASRGGGLPVGAYSFAHHNIELRQKFDEYLAIYLGSRAHRELMAAFGLSECEIDPIAPTPQQP